MLVSAEHGMIYTANYGGSSFSALRLGPGGEVMVKINLVSQIFDICPQRWAMW